MATHAHSYNSSSGADQLPLSERAIEINSAGFKKSIDERTFSDFNIDGSEKDWRQDAVEASGGASYHGDEKKKDDIENLRDAAELASETLDQARQEMIFKIGDYEFSKEALDETINKYSNDVDAWAEKNGISKEEAQADVTFMIALQNATPEQQKEMLQERAQTHPESAKRIMQDAADNDKKIELKTANAQQFESESHDVKSSIELTNEEQTAVVQDMNDGFADLGFDDFEDNSTSLAKSISHEESTVADIKGDFDQAVIAMNEPKVTTLDVAPTRESINIMDNAIG